MESNPGTIHRRSHLLPLLLLLAITLALASFSTAADDDLVLEDGTPNWLADKLEGNSDSTDADDASPAPAPSPDDGSEWAPAPAPDDGSEQAPAPAPDDGTQTADAPAPDDPKQTPSDDQPPSYDPNPPKQTPSDQHDADQQQAPSPPDNNNSGQQQTPPSEDGDGDGDGSGQEQPPSEAPTNDSNKEQPPSEGPSNADDEEKPPASDTDGDQPASSDTPSSDGNAGPPKSGAPSSGGDDAQAPMAPLNNLGNFFGKLFPGLTGGGDSAPPQSPAASHPPPTQTQSPPPPPTPSSVPPPTDKKAPSSPPNFLDSLLGGSDDQGDGGEDPNADPNDDGLPEKGTGPKILDDALSLISAVIPAIANLLPPKALPRRGPIPEAPKDALTPKGNSLPVVRGYIRTHNQVRLALGLNKLFWDESIAAEATRWSAKNTGCAVLNHSETMYGENIFIGDGRAHWTSSFVVQRWAEEVKFYNLKTNTCADTEQCGHYTQMVWNSTTRLGCGSAPCGPKPGFFVTCQYYPPGNYANEKPY